MSQLYACIDVGTNSALLLIAAIENGKLVPKIEKIGTCQLGSGIKTGKILPDNLVKLERELLRFRQTIHNVGAQLKLGVFTEAVRKADNPEDALDIYEKVFKREASVFTGQEEAWATWKGISHFHTLENFSCLDMGAGSSEIATQGHSHSFPLGALVLQKEFGSIPHDGLFADLEETFKDFDWEPYLGKPLFLSGGTASAFAMMEQKLLEFQWEKVEGFIVDVERVRATAIRLADISSEIREQMPGLSGGRSGIIIPGLRLMEAFLRKCNGNTIKVSSLGLRYGALVDRLGL